MAETERVFQAVKDRIAAEVPGGFPLLMRVPQPRIIQLIDCTGQLAGADRQALVAALAWRTTGILTGTAGPPDAAAAFDRFLLALNQPGPLTIGARDVPVRSLNDSRLPPLPRGARGRSAARSFGGCPGQRAPAAARVCPGADQRAVLGLETATGNRVATGLKVV